MFVKRADNFVGSQKTARKEKKKENLRYLINETNTDTEWNKIILLSKKKLSWINETLRLDRWCYSDICWWLYEFHIHFLFVVCLSFSSGCTTSFIRFAPGPLSICTKVLIWSGQKFSIWTHAMCNVFAIRPSNVFSELVIVFDGFKSL